MNNLHEIWELALIHLETLVSQDGMLVARALAVSERDGEIILSAPNKYALNKARQKLWTDIKKAFGVRLEQAKIFKPLRLELEALPDIFAQPSPEESFATGLSNEFRFDNFIRGHSNESAFIAAKAVATQYQNYSNPLMIYGAAGLGKSHLLHAIGNEMRARGLKKVLYISGEAFSQEVVAMIFRPNNHFNGSYEFHHKFHSLDALLIDDIQLISKKERSQFELFNIYNHLILNKKQIVFASDKHPSALINIEERLTSRFSHGVTVNVERPDVETRIAILKHKAGELNFDLPNYVVVDIANNANTRNVRDLEGELRTLYMAYSANPEALNSKYQPRASTPSADGADFGRHANVIQEIVCNHYGVKMEELLSKRRGKAQVVLARQMAMTLLKDLTSLSYIQIGERFGREHSTVIHAQKTIRSKCKKDEALRRDFEALKRRIEP